MSHNIENFPFEQTPGQELGRGFESIVKELGPEWVIKEFNPLKPDGTTKHEKAYEMSQSETNIKELQATQQFLQSELIFGDNFIPTHWVLGNDKEGNKVYFTIQKRFKGDTLEKVIESQDSKEKYDNRFDKYFEQNPELRAQMVRLIWGSKKALVEMGVFDDFHPDNIAVVNEGDNKQRLMIFDLQNMMKTKRLLYEDPNCPIESKRNILKNTERHASRIERYEEWLHITEAEKLKLNEEFKLENNAYENSVSKLLSMWESVKELK
ncbi:MAG: hypothetical protein AAB443_02165 [Patescibacteria group bacterium]